MSERSQNGKNTKKEKKKSDSTKHRSYNNFHQINASCMPGIRLTYITSLQLWKECFIISMLQKRKLMQREVCESVTELGFTPRNFLPDWPWPSPSYWGLVEIHPSPMNMCSLCCPASNQPATAPSPPLWGPATPLSMNVLWWSSVLVISASAYKHIPFPRTQFRQGQG